MEPNMIAIIVLLSLIGCAIIGVGIYFIVIFAKKNGKDKKKSLKGCKYKGDYGNCWKTPCKKSKFPY
jgi:flagellar basal body-associated protein FliL